MAGPNALVQALRKTQVRIEVEIRASFQHEFHQTRGGAAKHDDTNFALILNLPQARDHYHAAAYTPDDQGETPTANQRLLFAHIKVLIFAFCKINNKTR
jgi:hypothetical protein